jgi:hypothetical protein
MARLGDLLIEAGLLTHEQVDQALRAQIIWGGRLGTNLVELGFLDLDELTRVLARQLRIPAALSRHFEHADPGLQRLISAELADQWSCLPLATLPGASPRYIVATVGLLGEVAQAEIAVAMGIMPPQLVVAVAAELRIRYYLERVYQIPRATRFLRPRRHTTPAFDMPALPPDSDADLMIPIDTSDLDAVRDTSQEIAVDEFRDDGPHPDEGDDHDEADEDDELPPVDDAEPEPTPVLDELDGPGLAGESAAAGHERRRYLTTLADDAEPAAPTLGRIALRKVVVAPSSLPADEEPSVAATLMDATRAIRRSTDRDRVGELVIETVRRFAPRLVGVVILVLRHEVAVAWKGCCAAGETPPELVLPLDEPGLAQRALQTGMLVTAGTDELGPLDHKLIGCLDPTAGRLWMTPVMIGTRVVCLIAATSPTDEPSPNVLEVVASAAATAFARLMRAASR